jgi:hypothetical protein
MRPKRGRYFTLILRSLDPLSTIAHDSLAKRGVLVVDDDPVFRKIARAALEEACLDFIAACDMP